MNAVLGLQVTTALGLHATVLAGVLIGLLTMWRSRERRCGRNGAGGVARWYHRPGWWLSLVVAAVYLNQALFTVYALRVRHGDLSDLARLVPSGWFELADGRVTAALVAHVPAVPLLALSALRIPSLLELPFGLLIYLTVVNWLDPRWYRQLAAPAVLVPACAAYTVTFGLIEWQLHTPYTGQDLVLRAISGVLCAIALSRLGRHGSAPQGVGAPRSLTELAVFVVSAAALGYLVMVIYDTAMLYSLGRLGAQLPGAVVAGALLAASRLTAARMRRRLETSPPAADSSGAAFGVDTLGVAISWWLALFFIPALAIRYEVGFGAPLVAVAAGAVVVAAAVFATGWEMTARPALARHPRRRRIWLAQVVAAGLLGALAGMAGLVGAAAYPEIRLLRGAALFVLAAAVVLAGSDRWLRRRPRV